MKTLIELIDEVSAELNAIKAVDMGLEAAQAFAQDAADKQASGDVKAASESITNLITLLEKLRVAIPANVIPASAGPVGKSPDEQFIEQASAAVAESLKRMQGILVPLQEVLTGVSQAVEQAQQVTNIGKAVKDI